MKRYPQYRQSGIDWLGEVPSHWKTIRAKFLVSVSGGNTPSKQVPENWGGTVPWVSPKDMKSIEIHDSEDHLTERGLLASTSGLIPENSLLMVVRSGILQHCIPVAITRTQVTVNQDIRVIRPTGSIQPEYLLRQIQGLQKPFLAEWVKQGATVESVEQKYFAEIPIIVPSVKEQSDIVAYLDDQTQEVDALIAEKQELFDLLEEYRNSVLTEGVTKGFRGVSAVPTGNFFVPDIAQGWLLIQLKYLIGWIEQGWSPECENRLAEPEEWGVLKAGACNNGFFREAEHKALPSTLKPVPELEVQAGDVLMSRASGSAALVGSVAYVDSVRPHLMLSDKTFRFNFKGASRQILPKFLALVMNSRPLREQIRQYVSGAEGLAKNIGTTDIRRLMVPLPSVEEQQEIIGRLEAEFGHINALSEHVAEHIKLLREYKSALISEAVTGQIDVRGYGGDRFAGASKHHPEGF